MSDPVVPANSSLTCKLREEVLMEIIMIVQGVGPCKVLVRPPGHSHVGVPEIRIQQSRPYIIEQAVQLGADRSRRDRIPVYDAGHDQNGDEAEKTSHGQRMRRGVLPQLPKRRLDGNGQGEQKPHERDKYRHHAFLATCSNSVGQVGSFLDQTLGSIWGRGQLETVAEQSYPEELFGGQGGHPLLDGVWMTV